MPTAGKTMPVRSGETMTVFVLNAESESLRGELTRWFLEVKPNVFVGNVNVRIRDLLWKRICEGKAEQGSVMIYDAPNEQGFSMQLCGTPKRTVMDFDGIQLIKIMNEEGKKEGLDSLSTEDPSYVPGIF